MAGKGQEGQFRVVTEKDSKAKAWMNERSDADTLRILVATDNHVGFMERDPVRGMDSFAALEEIFIRAKQYNADAVLLGGDLFHDNKPSRKALHTTIGILRRNCLGDSPVSFEVISDQAENFKSGFGTVNYEDPNYSVGLPVFCIHGNHDDPSREGATDPLSALDLLSINNLINYFGKAESTNNIEVNPILLRKGTTQVALYGLGNIRDERLNRMWQQEKVKFLTHSDGTDNFFNLFVLHQNRDTGRGPKNCVHESMIPEWMDLVIWGHEHQCCIHPAMAAYGNDLRIVQPGSSVATSLVEGEAEPKMIGMLEIKDTAFRLYAIPLRQVRPFVMEDITLSAQDGLDSADPQVEERITEVLAEKVEEMIAKAKAANPEPPLLPGQQLQCQNYDQVLVRLRVDHTGFPTLNNQRFGARFVGQVANPTDILLFHKRKKTTSGASGTEDRAERATQRDTHHRQGGAGVDDDMEEVRVEDLVRAQIEGSEKKLTLLNEPEMYIALEDFVNKNSTNAISDVVVETLETTQKELNREMKGTEEATGEEIAERAALVQEKQRRKAEARLKAQMEKEGGKSNAAAFFGKKTTSAKKTKKEAEAEEDKEVVGDDDLGHEDEEEARSTSRSSKASSKATSSRAAANKAPSKKKAKDDDDMDQDDDDDIVNINDGDDDDDVAPKRSTVAITKRKPPPRAKATKKASKYADESDLSEEEDYIGEDDDSDDDDDDDLDDDDDDDDDSSSGGKKKKGAAKGGRKPAAGRGAKGSSTTAKKAPVTRGRGRGGGGGASRATTTSSKKMAAPSPKSKPLNSKLPWATGGTQRSTAASQSQSQQASKRGREVIAIDDDDEDNEEEDEGPKKKRSNSSKAAGRPPARDDDDDDDIDFDTNMLSRDY